MMGKNAISFGAIYRWDWIGWDGFRVGWGIEHLTVHMITVSMRLSYETLCVKAVVATADNG